MAFAFPDQCQMLLNKANGLMFQNTPQSKKAASVLYNRLVKRLSFWPTLYKTEANSGPTDKATGMSDAYDLLEAVLEVTISARDQLQSVYAQAKSFNNQILSGMDMFGHDLLWAPRLNYNYYIGEIADFISTLESLEVAYKNALSIKASLTDIASGQSAAVSGVQKARDRITLLISDNGPMASSADTVARYTPLVKAKLKECQERVADVAEDVRSSINMDPLDVLGGLSTLAMAPSMPLGLVRSRPLSPTSCLFSLTLRPSDTSETNGFWLGVG